MKGPQVTFWIIKLRVLYSFFMLSHIGNFLPFPPSWGPNPVLEIQIAALRPKSLPWGPNSSLEAQLPAHRLKVQPQDPNPSPKAYIPALGTKAQIPAPRLTSQSLEGKGEGESIGQLGHRPLYNRCTLYMFFIHHFWPKLSKEMKIATDKITTMLLIFEQFKAMFL